MTDGKYYDWLNWKCVAIYFEVLSFDWCGWNILNQQCFQDRTAVKLVHHSGHDLRSRSTGYHTLPITFLGPSLSGHPLLGISSPWVWLLMAYVSHGMAASDMLFCRPDMHVPAFPVGCCPAETTAGQASTWGPRAYTPCCRPDTSWLGCCGGQTGPKTQWKVTVTSHSRTKLMYLLCISNVSVMHWQYIPIELLDVFQQLTFNADKMY